jgi:hypothetical protein
MSEKTKVEIGLKEVLAECVEALRERVTAHVETIRHYEKQEKSDRDGWWAEVAESRKCALSRVRAALAVVERWAAVGLEVKQTSPTAVVCRATYEDEGMGRAWGQRVELRDGEWTVNLKSAEYGEAGGVACLAAALECRRRNEEV